MKMHNNEFGTSFMWYEWNFVAPDEFPVDTTDIATYRDTGDTPVMSDRDASSTDVQDEVPVWMRTM
jgi:hypothetical protein